MLPVHRMGLPCPMDDASAFARAHPYPLPHKRPLYAEPGWWRHAPAIPDLPGSDVPEPVDPYAEAFEKVWAHRSRLG